MKSQGLLGAFKKMECFLHFRLAVRTARVKPNLLSARNHHPRLLQFSRVQFHCVRTERGRKRERNSFHNSVTKSFLSLLISRSSAVDRVWLVGQHWARAVTSDFPQESPWCREDPFGTRVTSRRRVTVNSLYLPPVCCSQTFFFLTKFLRCFDCLFRSGGIPGLSTTWQENQKLFSEPFSKVARTSQKDEDRLSSLAVWLPPKRRSRET